LADSVQFCHGSPGVLPLLFEIPSFIRVLDPIQNLLGLKNIWKEEFLRKTKNSIYHGMQNIWAEGLLKKGFGLCHGISGNAFAFALAATSPDMIQCHKEREVFMLMAQAFAASKKVDFVAKTVGGFIHNDRFKKGSADFPFSLMNGLAGDLCLHLKLAGANIGFPGFNL
jgi:hypothetical protein